MIPPVRFPKVHIINSVNPSFEDMYSGKKKFEILFDPGSKKFQVKDLLHFIEHDYMMKPTERRLVFEIEYIFIAGNGELFPGFIVVALIKL